MINRFLVVGLSGVAICVACLSASALIGGQALRDNGFGFGLFGRPQCGFSESGRPDSRTLAWNGGDEAVIEGPATVHYRRGNGDQLVVKGDSEVISHIQVVDGKVRLNCRMRHGERFDVTLPGRNFRTFSFAGTGTITLDDIDQPDLAIQMAGAGDIEATGKTGRLELNVAGAGDARLGDLMADRVELNMAGSHDVEIAPKEYLEVNLAGSGRVVLRTEPHALETHILGSGRIIHPGLDKDM